MNLHVHAPRSRPHQRVVKRGWGKEVRVRQPDATASRGDRVQIPPKDHARLDRSVAHESQAVAPFSQVVADRVRCIGLTPVRLEQRGEVLHDRAFDTTADVVPALTASRRRPPLVAPGVPAGVCGIVDHDDARMIARGGPAEQAAKQQRADPSETADLDAAVSERGKIRTRGGPAAERIVEQAAANTARRCGRQRARQLAPQTVRSDDEALDVYATPGATDLAPARDRRMRPCRPSLPCATMKTDRDLARRPSPTRPARSIDDHLRLLIVHVWPLRVASRTGPRRSPRHRSMRSYDTLARRRASARFRSSPRPGPRSRIKRRPSRRDRRWRSRRGDRAQARRGWPRAPLPDRAGPGP